MAWHSWAQRMAKTHTQVACPMCGLFAIWHPKASARSVAQVLAEIEARFAEDFS